MVIGYIRNESKRFLTYVANRVDKIRRCSKPSDWNYVPTKMNPADEGTRSVAVRDMQDSLWLNGSPQLLDEVEDIDSADPNAEADQKLLCLKTEVHYSAHIEIRHRPI